MRERAHFMHTPCTVDFRQMSKLLIFLSGRIAQLVRALASHARGRRFESCCDHHESSREKMSRAQMTDCQR